MTQSSPSRQLAICTFADERSTTPKRNERVPWLLIVALHQKRRVRPTKSGTMLGGYALSGSRKDVNVPHRSLIQLDIDTVGTKEKATGRIMEVSRAAPTLDEIRSSIDCYEWCAASSHWHEPGRGVVKYRITILPDRDILPDEHESVLEALDGLLKGSLDRAAWPLSQAFYLPSCPAENQADAFFVHNRGTPLPVAEFVRRGRDIMAAREQAERLPKQEPPSRNFAPLSETPEEIARVESMLTAIPADIEHDPWTQVVWAVAATGWACAKKLARDWSTTCAEKWDEEAFESVWRSFDPARGEAIGFGTLVYIAKQRGWVESTAIDAKRINGHGGDVKNGQIFALTFRGRLLHVHETNEWLVFDVNQGWIYAPPLEADRAAKEILRILRDHVVERYKSAPDEQATKRLMAHVERTSKLPHLRAMIETAKSEPGMTVRLSEFDNDPMLLGVGNGVLDLSKGGLLPVAPTTLVSKRCNVSFDPIATCPRFEMFMLEVQPDDENRRFVQRFLGYCLTGLVTEQIFAFLHGLGANGKSVMIEILAWLLGDYALKIQTEMLMRHQRSPHGPSPDIVALKGIRLAYANETEEGQRLDDARVKDMTGGDTLTGRVPYGIAAITFTPTHKLVVVGNHKPDIADTSHGMWRRVMLIPFDQTIPKECQDSQLLDKLKTEGSGILNWMLDGLWQWKRDGLQVPDAIKASTGAYREEQDILGEWIFDRCNTGTGCSATKRELYDDYVGWARANGHGVLAQGRLTRRLHERGYRLAPDKRTMNGISLKPNAPFLSRNV